MFVAKRNNNLTMKKTIINFAKTLNKTEQKSINGSGRKNLFYTSRFSISL